MADETSNTSAVKKSYEASFKLQVIDYSEKNTNRGAAREFSINEKLIREWRKQKEQLQQLPPESTRLPPQGTPQRRPGPKRTYSPAFKLQIIEKAEQNSNRSVARQHDIDEKMIREWRKQKEALKALPPQKQKMGNSGLRPLLPELEKTLVEWIKQQPVRPTNVQIQAKALELNDGKADFKASRGWLDKFMHRHSLHARRMKESSEEIAPVEPVIATTMEVDSVISQIIPGEGEAINIQDCLDVANVEETGTKRRKFDPSFKLMVLEHAENTSNREAAREFNVDERMVRGWKSQKEHLQSLPQGETEIPSEEVTLQATAEETGEPSTPTKENTNLSQVSTPGETPRSYVKKRKYDTSFKLEVVEYAEKSSNRGAGRHFNVDEKRVREWRKQKELLQALPPGKQKVGKSGCHPLVPELEETLASWIRDSPVRPTHTKIQAKALELYEGEKPFKASRGWLEKFMHRHSLSLSQGKTEIDVPQLEMSVTPGAIQVTPEELNEVDIQACLNLAKSIEESVKQGGDESALILAKSIEESVKKTIAETLAKNAQENPDAIHTAIQTASIETLTRSIEEGLAKSVGEGLDKPMEEGLAKSVEKGSVEHVEGVVESMEGVVESVESVAESMEGVVTSVEDVAESMESVVAGVEGVVKSVEEGVVPSVEEGLAKTMEECVEEVVVQETV